MPLGALRTPRTPRRRTAPGPLGSVRTPLGANSTEEQKELPKHAWWRDLFSWKTGPGDTENEKGGGLHSPTPSSPSKQSRYASNQSPAPSTPSNHLKWARHVNSVQGDWLREQRSLRVVSRSDTRCESRPDTRCDSRNVSVNSEKGKDNLCGSLDPRRSPTKYGAAYCFNLDAEALQWVQALRGSESTEPLAIEWQEAKSRRIKIDRALRRLQASQTKWLQDRVERTRLRKLYQEQLEYDEDEVAISEEDFDDEGSTFVVGQGSSLPSAITSPEASPRHSASPQRRASTFSVDSDSEHGGHRRTVNASPKRECSKRLDSMSDSGSSRSSSNEDMSRQLTSEVGHQANHAHVAQYLFGAHAEDEDTSPKSPSSPSMGASSRTSLRATPGGRATPIGTATPEMPYEEGGMQVAQQASTIPEEADELPLGHASTVAHTAEVKRASSCMFTHSNAKRASFFSGAPETPANAFAASLEEWFPEFPIETLDILADFLESHGVLEPPMGSSPGARTAEFSEVKEVLARLFSCPEEVVFHQAMAGGFAPATATLQQAKFSGLLSTSREVLLTFDSISHFFHLALMVYNDMEKDHPQYLWTAEELKFLEEKFTKQANSQSRLGMAVFFDVIRQLDFSELKISDLEEQKWLKNVVGGILEGRRVPENHHGTISFDEFCRIVTTAKRLKARARREIDCKRELEACRQAGFSPIEMEDLRELHRRYSKLVLPDNLMASVLQDPVLRMTTLLESCTPQLSQSDRDKLTDIIRESDFGGFDTSEALKRVVGDGIAPFDLFMIWMKEVLAEGLGGMKWTASTLSEDGAATQEEELRGHHGFAAVFLREHARAGRPMPTVITHSVTEPVRASHIGHAQTEKGHRKASGQASLSPLAAGSPSSPRRQSAFAAVAAAAAGGSRRNSSGGMASLVSAATQGSPKARASIRASKSGALGLAATAPVSRRASNATDGREPATPRRSSARAEGRASAAVPAQAFQPPSAGRPGSRHSNRSNAVSPTSPEPISPRDLTTREVLTSALSPVDGDPADDAGGASTGRGTAASNSQHSRPSSRTATSLLTAERRSDRRSTPGVQLPSIVHPPVEASSEDLRANNQRTLKPGQESVPTVTDAFRDEFALLETSGGSDGDADARGKDNTGASSSER